MDNLDVSFWSFWILSGVFSFLSCSYSDDFFEENPPAGIYWIKGKYKSTLMATLFFLGCGPGTLCFGMIAFLEVHSIKWEVAKRSLQP